MAASDKRENSLILSHYYFCLKLLSFLQDETLGLNVIFILSHLLNFTLQINNQDSEGHKLSDGGGKPWRQMIKSPS